MHLPTIIALPFSLLLIPLSAHPTAPIGGPQPLGARTDGSTETAQDLGVYLCQDVNWGGACTHATSYPGQCIVLAGAWDDALSSVGPDPNTICTFFNDNACHYSSGYFAAVYPGVPDLGRGGWNDRVGSYSCAAT